jgi:lipopolysaccharide transport system permease protein
VATVGLSALEEHESAGTKAFRWISEFWHYRELLYFLAWREVKVRYKQAALGAAWAIIQPLFTMIIFTLFFGRLAAMPSEGIPYPLFSFCALVPWTYFAGTLGLAGNSLVSNANLVTKVYFPRVLLPAATVISGMLDFLIGSIFLFFMMIYYHVKPGWQLLFVPVFILHMMLLALGISLLLAAINVRYRDVKYALPFIIQIWLFVTPIIYPVSFLPAKYQKILAFNPMAGIVEGMRACLFAAHQMPWKLVEISWAVTLFLLIVGAVYFRKTEKTFADIV